MPDDHPLRKIRLLVDEVLKDMSPQFGKLYSDVGRPSIAPERLLRALLLQLFYSLRSSCHDGAIHSLSVRPELLPVPSDWVLGLRVGSAAT